MPRIAAAGMAWTPQAALNGNPLGMTEPSSLSSPVSPAPAVAPRFVLQDCTRATGGDAVRIGTLPDDNGGNYRVPDQTQRWARRVFRTYRRDPGLPASSQPILSWGPSAASNVLVAINPTGKLELYVGAATIAGATFLGRGMTTLAANTEYGIDSWQILNGVGGPVLAVPHWVVRLYTNLYAGVPPTSSDEIQAFFGSSTDGTDPGGGGVGQAANLTLPFIANAGMLNYGSTFYAAIEDANDPFGLPRVANYAPTGNGATGTFANYADTQTVGSQTYPGATPSTINVGDTTTFPATSTHLAIGSTLNMVYTGKTATTLTGVTGGSAGASMPDGSVCFCLDVIGGSTSPDFSLWNEQAPNQGSHSTSGNENYVVAGPGTDQTMFSTLTGQGASLPTTGDSIMLLQVQRRWRMHSGTKGAAMSDQVRIFDGTNTRTAPFTPSGNQGTNDVFSSFGYPFRHNAADAAWSFADIANTQIGERVVETGTSSSAELHVTTLQGFYAWSKAAETITPLPLPDIQPTAVPLVVNTSSPGTKTDGAVV